MKVPIRVTVGLLVLMATACGGPTEPVGPACPGTGVAFTLTGALTIASAPFALSDAVSGCMRVEPAAAIANHMSTNASDVIAYTFTIGGQTWAGTGADFRGPFRFSISADEQLLFFQHMGGVRSTPDRLSLDIVTDDPNPTQWVVNAVSPVPTRAVGTMMFSR